MSARQFARLKRAVLVLAAVASVVGPAAAAAQSSAAPTVYFIGDSVTAGFGYCGTEGGSNSSHISCKPNQPFANSWYFGDNSLNDCNPPTPVNDRCSNDNDKGAPWEAGPWKAGHTAPTVAYPYVIAREQSTVNPAPIQDWAITGSTPADWDPKGGPFGPQLAKIKNSYVVMTLGANPLLSDYLKITLGGVYPATVGVCADSTVFYELPRYYAADPFGPVGKPGSLLTCFDKQWEKVEQNRHLLDVYTTLLQHGNHVLVLGYPKECPWSFGNFQPEGNIADGPAEGYSCMEEWYYNVNHTSERVYQWQQALALGDALNGRLQEDVEKARRDGAKLPGQIRFVLPGADWAQHQAWTGNNSWFFKNDTWVHPNAAGHKQLAATVVAAMCRDYGHWCGSPVKW